MNKDFGDVPVRVKVYASEETVEIFVEADLETHAERAIGGFAILNLPRDLFSEATGEAARRASRKRALMFRLFWTQKSVIWPVHGEFVNYAAIGIWNRPRQWCRQA